MTQIAPGSSGVIPAIKHFEFTPTVNSSYVLVIYSGASFGSITQVVIYQVKLFVNDINIYNVVDILENRRSKYIYLENGDSITLSSTRISEQFILYKVDTTTYALSTESLSGSSPTYTYTATASGFYFLEHRSTNPPNNYTISYQSQGYICPYDSTYTDVYKTFVPCRFAPPNPENAHQAYVIQAHACGTRQYFWNNETCMNVNEECNTFDTFSGACYTCQKQNYLLVNGKCIPP